MARFNLPAALFALVVLFQTSLVMVHANLRGARIYNAYFNAYARTDFARFGSDVPIVVDKEFGGPYQKWRLEQQMRDFFVSEYTIHNEGSNFNVFAEDRPNSLVVASRDDVSNWEVVEVKPNVFYIQLKDTALVWTLEDHHIVLRFRAKDHVESHQQLWGFKYPEEEFDLKSWL